MNQKIILLFALGFALPGYPALKAAEKDPKSAEEKKKKEEEKFRDLVKQTFEKGDVLPKSGIFHWAPEETDESRKPPIVVGSLDEKGGASYTVMALEPALMEQLKVYHNKNVILMGKLMQKGDNSVWMVSNLVETSGGAQPVRRKRGGL